MSQKITSRHIKTGLRAILLFLTTYKKEVIILFVASLITAIGNGIVPYITGKLFDSILYPQLTWTLFGITLPQIIWILMVLAFTQTSLAILDYHNAQKRSMISFLARFDYSVRAYSKLLELPMEFHKKNKMGGVISRIGEAGWGMQTLIGRLLSNVGADLLTVIVAIVVIFIIEPYVAIFSVVGLLIYLIIALLNLKETAHLESRYHEAWDRAQSTATDSVMNVSTIKQATAENYEHLKMHKSFFKNLMPFWLKESDIWRSLIFYQKIVILVIQIIVFIWSIQLVTQGLMTLGELIAFNSYLGMLFGPFANLLNMSKTIQSAIININSVEKIIALPSEKYEPTNGVELKTVNGNIKFENVAFSYNANKPVLRDINFEVKAGQVVALVGQSGVGKSTLIDLLSAYHFPTRGKVSIDNVDVRRINLKTLRSAVAIVPQEVVLFNENIIRNIKYGNFKATDEQVKEAARKAHALSFIEKFPKKWNQLVGERGIKLSVGQKQRVAIARAILRDPKILILDEPTSALDAKSEKIIQESLEELMKGRTTFIVAHRLSTVRKADLILVFEEGKIVESGNHQELIEKENGVYRNLYELQVGLHD